MKNLAIAKLQNLSLHNTLAHAWLFIGYDQEFIYATAQDFSQWLLCQQRQESTACGVCKACAMFKAHTHPDFYMLAPEADKATISIDAVRVVVDFVHSKPQFAKQKIILINPASALNQQAANALLKSLEEPASDTIYILISKNHELLLNTIVSRCQVLNFAQQLPAHSHTGEAIQRMAGDLTHLWIEKRVTVVQTVDGWLKQWPHEVLYWLEIVLTDVIRFKYTQDTSLAKCWCADEAKLSAAISVSKFWAILERLREAQKMLNRNQNPNMQLLLENVLL